MIEATMSPMLITLHISAGSVSLIAGAVAMIYRKGSGIHRKAGNWFVVAMLMMASLGAYGASFAPFEPLDFLNGVFTCYLVSTGWFSAMRRYGKLMLFERCLPLITGFLLIAYAQAALFAYLSETGSYGGYPSVAYLLFGLLVCFALVGDVRQVWRKRVFEGNQRIIRHLWRMVTGMFFAYASFFLGQQQVFPEVLRGTIWLALPVILVMLSLLYWLARVQTNRLTESRSRKANRRASTWGAPGDVQAR
jgi:uncharacterized membrane protein